MADIALEWIRQVATVLGGKRVLRTQIADPAEMRSVIRRGLPYQALEQVIALLRLGSDEEISAVTGMATRTLARRKITRTLRPDESDRLYRVARVAARAIEVLGSAERAVRWLKKPQQALGNEVPLDLLDTDVGSRQVEAVLGRIEHGVFS